MLQIREKLTEINRREAENRDIRFLVIHYTGSLGTAENCCRYFQSAYRSASAHYFVGYEGEVWRCVQDKDIAWHCGTTGTYRHPVCRNDNSIGIELCVRNPNGSVNSVAKDAGWYFEPETVKAAVRLVKMLMKQYQIPVENVIRHYDVTGKVCPQPYVVEPQAWEEFRKQVVADSDPDPYAEASVTAARAAGILVGDETGNLRLHEPVTRQDLLVILDRCGIVPRK